MSSHPDDDPSAQLPPRWTGQPGYQPPFQPSPRPTPPPAPQPAAPQRQRPAWQSASAVIVAMNVLVWLLITATGGNDSLWADRLGLRRLGVCVEPNAPGTYYPSLVSEHSCAGIGQWLPGATDGAPWQVLTNAFTQIEPLHLGLNMLALIMLGPVLERALGTPRFLVIYLVSALCGSAAVVLLTPPQSLTVGASGAIFGLLGSLLIVTWRFGGDYRGVLVWLGINVAYTFTGGNISWQGHLGGLLGGVIVTLLLLIRTPRRRRPA